MNENKDEDSHKKEWRSSFSLSRKSKYIIESLVKCNLVKNYSDGIDTILIKWADSSDGRRLLNKANKISSDLITLRENLKIS